jgi:hypothetical protein
MSSLIMQGVHIIHLVRLAYQPPANILLSQNKPATSNQPAVLLSQNKPAPAISHQPNEQADYPLKSSIYFFY